MAPFRQLNLEDEEDFLDLLERFYSTHPAHATARLVAEADCLPVAQTTFLRHLADIAAWARAAHLITEADAQALLDRSP